jgi:preprotein translocase subunit YajC
VDQYGGLLILAVLLVLLFLFSAGSRRRQQRRQSLVRTALRAGDRVMTTSGLYGTLVAVDDPEVVVLEVAPGVHTTWVRAAIAEVVQAPADQPAEAQDDPRDEDRTEFRTGPTGTDNG